jgi:hypothetical protein
LSENWLMARLDQNQLKADAPHGPRPATNASVGRPSSAEALLRRMEGFSRAGQFQNRPELTRPRAFKIGLDRSQSESIGLNRSNKKKSAAMSL